MMNTSMHQRSCALCSVFAAILVASFLSVPDDIRACIQDGNTIQPRSHVAVPEEIQKTLNIAVPSLVFQDERFEAAIKKIASLSGLKIEPDWSALECQAIEKESRFSLRLENVRFGQAIELVLNQVGEGEVELKYYVDGEIIRITVEEPTRMTKTPNIKDLLITIPPYAEKNNRKDSDVGLPHEAAEAAFEKRLSDTIPELVLNDIAFEDALEKLATAGGLNIVPSWSAMEAQAIEKDQVVNLRFKNEQIGRSLQLILDEVGGGEVQLGFVVDGTLVRVSTIEDLSRIQELIIYNVGDLVRGADPESLFIPAEHKNDPGWLMQDQVKAISQLIMETVDPESWLEAGGNVGTLKTNGDILVINQCKSAHLEIKTLLQDLRDERNNREVYSVEAEIVRVSASVEANWRQTAAAHFPSFSKEEFSKIRLNTQGISRLTRGSGTVQESQPMRFESYWQQPASDPSRDGTYFGVNTSISFFPKPAKHQIRFRVNLELVGPVDLPVGSSAVTGPQDVSPVNWKAAGVKTWQVRRVSTVVTVKAGEAIALMIPPENPGQVDGSSSDWILIYPPMRK